MSDQKRAPRPPPSQELRRRGRHFTLREAEAIVGRRRPFSIREAAEFLGVATKTIDRWSRDPDVDLRVTKIRKTVLIDVREIARLIEGFKG